MRELKIGRSITPRDSRGIEKYLQELNKIDLISPEEEVELVRRIKKGDIDALHKLTRANLRFVVSVAKQYSMSTMSLNDLINEGNAGLMKAAQKFDETRGFKFISYAVWWIRQSIIAALAEHGRIVRVPLNKVGTEMKVDKAIIEFEVLNEREPTDAELVEITGFTTEEVSMARDVIKKHLSIDAPMGHDSDSVGMHDVMEGDPGLKPDDELGNESLARDLKAAMATLHKKQREALEKFFGIGCEPMSLEDVAASMDLTKERVRQIKDKAITRIKYNPKYAELLKAHLGK